MLSPRKTTRSTPASGVGISPAAAAAGRPGNASSTKASRWTSGTDWVALAAACLRVLSPGGHLLACSNDRRMPHNKFRRYLHEGAREAGVSLAQLKDLPCSSDFPPPVGREPHLKSLLARLE